MARRNHVLLHLMPADALRKARDLALRIERDRVLRRYLVRRLWFLLPACVLLVELVFAVIAALAAWFFQEFPGPSYRVLRYAVGIAAGMAWIALSCAVLYALFAWLERRVAAELEKRKLRRAFWRTDD